jgi:hypothetical protein
VGKEGPQPGRGRKYRISLAQNQALRVVMERRKQTLKGAFREGHAPKKVVLMRIFSINIRGLGKLSKRFPLVAVNPQISLCNWRVKS